MATEWLPCGGGFIKADVFRWTEAVWHKSKRGRATKAGERQAAAEVIGDTDGWLRLLARDCRLPKMRDVSLYYDHFLPNREVCADGCSPKADRAGDTAH